MNHGSFFLLCFILALSPQLALPVTFKFEGQTFTLPDGFTIEKVAGPGLVDRPVVADFDEIGRLYVADSSGSNDPVQKQLTDKPHRIVRLEDVNGDGIFDKSVVFAERMMFPEGAMWFDGSLYVSAPPSIWKLTDTNDDGIADKREEWFQGKTLTGCANDLHGPYLGPDGWIYWCKGAFAEQTYERPGKPPFVTRAAHIFRCNPDGSSIEAVMTGGMDNPVDVVFTPEGERIFTTTFLQNPGGGKRDGLIHAIYGGVYGKVHGVLDNHIKTGEIMPVLTHLGPAAPCGFTRYESTTFGPAYKDNLFAALFNMHKVTRHVLKPDRATYRAEDHDFLVSDSTDFHPTDVLEDADGSLLVIDTGGWYKICCPTSQLWKPDILGAIYRIRRSNAPVVSHPRGSDIRWDKMNRASQFAALLGDARPAVRKRAINELSLRGDNARAAAAKILSRSKSEEARRNAVWTLARLDSPQARAVTRGALKDKSPSVRHAAIHAISLWRDREAVEPLLHLLKEQDPALIRAAFEALGRIGEGRASAPILDQAAKLTLDTNSMPERVMEHSLIFALIEIGDTHSLRAALDRQNPLTQRAALIALDQLKSEALHPTRVIHLLSSETPLLRNTATWIINHRKDWGPSLVPYYQQKLAQTNFTSSQSGELASQMAIFAADPEFQKFLAQSIASESIPAASKTIALKSISLSGIKEVPPAWIEPLTRILNGSDASLKAGAVNSIAALTIKTVPETLKISLKNIAMDRANPDEIRLRALSVISTGEQLGPLFDFVREQLAPEKSFLTRGGAAGILSKASFTEEQLLLLAEDLRIANPLEISKLLAPFENATSEMVGRKVLASLKNSKGLPGLNADRIKQLFSKYPAGLQQQAAELVSQIDEEASQQAAKIDSLLPQLKNGDIRRGQALFNSQKTACSSCHAIGYMGGNLGPDLTRIGQVRTERDLLEAVIFPSASFVRSYEPIVVSTKDGEQHSGVLRKDAPEEVILGTGPGAEVRLPRQEIADIQPGKVSVMPQGLDQQLSTQELADLVAFLKATKW